MRNPLKTSTQRPSVYTAERAALSRNVRHPAHRSWKGWDRPRLPWQDLSRTTLRRLWLLHNPTFLANGGATPHEYCLLRQREHIGPWQWRGCTGTWPPQKDDQAGPAVLSGQFRVSSGLPRSGNVQGLVIDRGCPCTSSAFASNWGDHGRDRF